MMTERTTDRRVVRSKSALKQALLTLMEKKPFSQITITEMVEYANYNRGTFYMHYDNKEALLGDIVGELMAKLIEAYRAPYLNAETLQLETLSANAVAIFDHIYQHSSLYTVLLHSEVLPLFRENMFRALTRVMIEDFDFSTDEERRNINKELHMTYTAHALIGLAFHWVEGGFPYTPEYMEEQLLLIIKSKPEWAVKIKR